MNVLPTLRFLSQLALSPARLLPLSLSLLLPLSAAAAAAATKPNLLVILADDLGYGDVQCYNPTRGKIPTPHIDRLAAQGMRFTDGHSSSGVCSPTRYTLLTGRYHWRTKLQSGIVGVFGEPLIAPDRMTIGTLAQQHGYRTAAIGKWHLGWDWPIAPAQRPLFQAPRPAAKAGAAAPATAPLSPSPAHLAAWREVFAKPIAGGPTTRGFDTYFGTDVPNWPPFCFIENDRTLGLPSEFLPAPRLVKNQASLPGPALTDWQLEGILPALADRAVAFITAAATRPEPFLLYLPLTSPHTPVSVNKEWQGRSGLNLYADFVMETDAVVGRVLAALEQSGAAANTLVIFTSDNGCAPSIDVAGLEAMGHYPSGPLRGYKADAWEGGHRVPFIVRWPGQVKSGSVCDQLVQQSDLLATFAAALGTQLPDNAGEDSVSLLPALLGIDRAPLREAVVHHSIQGLFSLRQGPWKLALCPGSGGWAAPLDAAARQAGLPEIQLYDLAADPAESNNIHAENPTVVARLRALLARYVAEGRSTPGPRQPNDAPIDLLKTKAAAATP